MRPLTRLALAALGAASLFNPAIAAEDSAADEKMLQAIYSAALTSSPAYENLRELVTKYPGRLAGSKNLEGAVQWGEAILKSTGATRTELQPVMVPHWERGAPESVTMMIPSSRVMAPLSAVALGGSVPTPADGLRAQVIELHSFDELQLKANRVQGKIVFFNRPMNPAHVVPGKAYGEAADQRSKGPAEAVKYGAVGVLVRSLTHAHDDLPHTGNTTYPPDGPRIPAAALSTVAADHLSKQLRYDSFTPVLMKSIPAGTRTPSPTTSSARSRARNFRRRSF